jgi:hypothetical protein
VNNNVWQTQLLQPLGSVSDIRIVNNPWFSQTAVDARLLSPAIEATKFLVIRSSLPSG